MSDPMPTNASPAADTAPDARSAPPAALPARPVGHRSGRLVLLLLLMVLLLAALGAAAWQAVQVYHSERAAFLANQTALQSRLDTLDAALLAAEQGASARSDDLDRAMAVADALQARVGELETALGSLQSAQQHSRSLAQLLAVEQLLMLAAERLQLAHDVATARRALNLADERLASLRDPRLLALREAISDLGQTLRATPTPDTTAMTLTLSSLIDRAPALTLASSLPVQLGASPVPAAATDASWWQRMAQALRATLAQIFIVHHDSGPQPQLLSVEQHALIGQVLMLRLEGARAALLRQDVTAFRLQCESALSWLEQYYDRSRPDAQAVAATLRELIATPLATPLPDLAPVAAQLRALIDARQTDAAGPTP